MPTEMLGKAEQLNPCAISRHPWRSKSRGIPHTIRSGGGSDLSILSYNADMAYVIPLLPRVVCPAVAALCIAVPLLAGDWPQYRGIHRDGVTTERIPTTFPTTRPREIWQAQVGRGHAAVSIADGRAITIGYSGKANPLKNDPENHDTVFCFDAATGKELWRFDYANVGRLKDEPGNGAYDGPHATPLILKDRVYTLSRTGKVHCLDAATGTLLWDRDLLADDAAKLPECGFAGSPLAVDDSIIVSVGAAGTALDAATGTTKWKSSPEIAGYAAPTLVTDARGARRLIFFGYKELFAVDPTDGKQLWSFPWPTKWGANATDPVAIGDALFITSAYTRGCALVDLETGSLRYQSKIMTTHCCPPILRDGAYYGFSGYMNDDPDNDSLACIDPLKGTEFWRQTGMCGQVILADGDLVILLTTGDLVVVRATPKAYEEIARTHVLAHDECPVPPVLCNSRLYLRTAKGLLTCLDVSP